MCERLENGLRKGVMRLAPSKSHAHRVLIAEFLAGRTSSLGDAPVDCDDILATKRCLRVLSSMQDARSTEHATLDVGESGTTRRLLGPVVAALGVTPNWVMRGRLASRPQIDYADLKPGVQELPGDVSSQFISGLLFALPILKGDSEIRLTTPLASRGYVEMTLEVLKTYGIVVEEISSGFLVPGNQKYVAPAEGPKIEGDWSGAAFILAMDALGNAVELSAADRASLSPDSRQPDKAIVPYLAELKKEGEVTLDVDACPDIFPILTIVAAFRDSPTIFTGTKRLKIKESDRTSAMADVLANLGARCEVHDDNVVVSGTDIPRGGAFQTQGDHRIAMAIAVAATQSDVPIELDNTACAAKSFPTFFEDFNQLEMMK